MKRIAGLILALCLFICGAAWAAPITIDPDTATVDELIEAKKAIDLALFGSDAYESVIIPVGTYEIGVHMPAGEYTVSCDEGLMRMTMIQVFSDGEKSLANYVDTHSIANDEVIGRLVLKEGYVMEVNSDAAVFRAYTGLGF